ncbi:MAG: GIY-YIG nuclease family protein [Planctomycetes bacterium]|nr:GIY-YIG nuclease family protein [Planctomycetota bacterium]
MKQYFVYMMTNLSGTLYTGVTGNLRRRVYEHKCKVKPGFTAQYNINRLVYYEYTTDVLSAIEREKEIKGWKRAKKIQLVEAANRNWKDLAADWFTKPPADLTVNNKQRDSSLRSE